MIDNQNAPGTPGIPGKWTFNSKSGIGKALNANTQISFSHGILNKVYYLCEDNACIRDIEFLIAKKEVFFQKRNAIPGMNAERPRPASLFTK